MSRLILIAPMVLALVACGGEEKADPRTDRDPAVSAALDDPLMADPDLASQNRGNSALSGGGPATAEIPPDKRGNEEIDRAKLAALDPAPLAGSTKPDSRLAKAVTLEGVAEALKLGAPGCPAKLAYGFGWAAQMPAALPVYPRGHTRVAAGTDEGGCRLRLVRFVTPVAAGDVVDFYHASATKYGLGPQRSKEGSEEVLSGRKGNARFEIYVRTLPDGQSEIDLATSGL
jgi:hypothetical protein